MTIRGKHHDNSGIFFRVISLVSVAYLVILTTFKISDTIMLQYSLTKIVAVVVFFCCFFTESESKVLLISMDGFRWDYIKQVNTPNFDKFAAAGTRAEYINNTFVTKTFPCHYTIATGKLMNYDFVTINIKLSYIVNCNCNCKHTVK